MFVLQLSCSCGFASKLAVWGPRSLFEQGVVGMPVFLTRSGELITHWFDSEALKIQSDELDAWITRYGNDVLARLYGEGAVPVTPSNNDDLHLLCPACHAANLEVVIVAMH